MPEINFDGIPGPTHGYAGLAPGNLAGERNAGLTSNPREAALQGLAKMRTLAALGYPQAVVPPHERPAIAALRRLGFTGTERELLARAAKDAPQLLAACSSAAAMWTANAATVSPSADTADRRVHFTAANLIANFHRAIESATTTTILRAIFADPVHFVVHEPLPQAPQLGDAGAANHTRFVAAHASSGVEFFVYGRRGFGQGKAPAKFPARQTFEASAAVARLHRLDPAHTVFAQQSPRAIDAGVFHNDVIAVGNGSVLFCHEHAWLEQPQVLAELAQKIGPSFVPIMVTERQVPLADAVASYLFNSQLLTRPDGLQLLVAPQECRENTTVARFLDQLVARDGPIAETRTFDLRQSMRNGGGPACLRLRVSLKPLEQAAIKANVWLTDSLATELQAWIIRHYRDRLDPADLADPALLDESRRALDQLTALLRLPAIYPFQRG